MRNKDKVIIRKTPDYNPEIIPKIIQEGFEPFGLQEMMNIKFISHDFPRKKSHLCWYPFSKNLPYLLDKSLILFYHHQLRKKAKILFFLLPYRSRIRTISPISNCIKNIFKMFKK